MSVVFGQVEVSASGRSLVKRNPTECGVSGCEREASDPLGAVVPWEVGGGVLAILACA